MVAAALVVVGCDQDAGVAIQTTSTLDPASAALAAIREESICPSNVDVNPVAFDEFLTEIGSYYEVVGVHAASRVTERRSPGLAGVFMRLDTVHVPSDAAEMLEFRLSGAWSDSFEAAVGTPGVSTYIGVRPGVEHDGGVEPPIVSMAVAVASVDVVFSGLCSESRTDSWPDGAELLREIMHLDPEAAAQHFREVRAEHHGPPPDHGLMPQVAPGLVSDVELDLASVVWRAIRVEIADGSLVDETICVGTDVYVGECAVLGAFESDGGVRAMTLMVQADPDDEIYVYVERPKTGQASYPELARVSPDEFGPASDEIVVRVEP